MPFFLFLDRCVKRTVDISIAASVGLLLFMALFGSLDVVMTFLFHKPVPLARELSEVLLAIVIFGAMGVALRDERHINVDLFVGNASPAVKRVSRILSLILGAAVFALLTWRSTHFASSSFAENEVAAAVYRFPVWPVKIAVAVAMLFTFLEFLRQLAWEFAPGRDSSPPADLTAEEKDT